LAEEFGEASPEGRVIGHYIKQEELAAMIGAPREMVSSLLTQFRQRHLVSYSRRRHLAVDTTALRAYVIHQARRK
jgi:CRP-like cAMP-binding protein